MLLSQKVVTDLKWLPARKGNPLVVGNVFVEENQAVNWSISW